MPYHSGFGTKEKPPVRIGIKPTKDDHEFVKSLSVIGMGVRDICVSLGERFKLGKPMSRMTMYWHFKVDLVKRPRGPRPKKATLQRRHEESITAEMKRLIEEASRRGKAKTGG